MKPATNTGASATVGQLLKRKLKELEKSSAELAEAAQVPTEYIDDLIAGRRAPPLPSRTDIYQPMTSFLGLGRNELAASAQYERDNAKKDVKGSPAPAVHRLLLDLCNSKTAEELAGKKSKADKAVLADLMHRLLNVAQTEVRRVLLDPTALRVAAERNGTTSNDARFAVLEFLDAGIADLTPNQVNRFVLPRIVEWGTDPEYGALKVVLRSQ